MNSFPAHIKAYLNKYLSDNYLLEWNQRNSVQNVIVIPAIAEFDNLSTVLKSLLKNDDKYFSSTLVVFVINNSASANDDIKRNNLKSIELIRSIINGGGHNQLENVNTANLNIGLVDASTHRKAPPDKFAGVGLARKIGMDLSLTAFDFNKKNGKIIFCADADCTFSQNYINEVTEQFNKRNISAGYVNFQHNINYEDENTKAIICYEIFLRYYVMGLKYAQSPYAFHTIGSTMICDADSYVKIGGMNKRKAAEDFYFLEKLAKSYNIIKINSAEVYPSNRKSWRVPFGTGQRVNRFLSAKQNEYLLYNPQVFEILKQWLKIFNDFSGSNIRRLLTDARNIHKELYNYLNVNSFEKQWESIINHTSTDEQFAYQKKIWFDGFRTLKFIHHLRDNAFPEINMFDALDIFFKKISEPFQIIHCTETIPNIDIQRDYLLKLREIENNDN